MKPCRVLTAGIIFICTLFFVIACYSFKTLSSNQNLETTNIESVDLANHSIRFGCSYDWAGWWPWAVAQEQQLFETNGVNVELQWFDDYYEALDALAQGILDANCQVFNDTVAKADQAINGEVVVLVTDNSDGNDKIVATDAIEAVTDLVGHRVGVEKGKLTDFLLTLALEDSGISRDAINIRYLNTAVGAIAFVAGELEAIVAWQPDWLTALRRPGSHELLSSHDLPGAIPQVVAVSQRAITEKGAEIQALVNTWFDTLKFIRDYPEQSKKIMLRRSTLSDINYQRFLQGVRLFSASENITAFSSGETLEHLSFMAQKAADFLVDAREISQSPNLAGLLNDEFVSRYKSKTVRALGLVP
ncbi:MAG: aliphatic sulfonate ABC transporter substrate-binding protein [Leptolyngbyaceae cyanobacterium]